MVLMLEQSHISNSWTSCMMNKKVKINGDKELIKHCSRQKNKKTKRFVVKLDGMDPSHYVNLLALVSKEVIARLRLHDCFKTCDCDKFSEVLEAIRDNPSTQVIDLDVKHNQSDARCTQRLSELLANQRLSTLRLPLCATADLYHLLGTVTNIENEIHELDLFKNRLDEGCIRRLIRAIKRQKIKRTLDLSECVDEDGKLLTREHKIAIERANHKCETLKIKWFSMGQIQEFREDSVLNKLLNSPRTLNPTLELIKNDKGRTKIAMTYFRTVQYAVKKIFRKSAKPRQSSEEDCATDDTFSASSSGEECEGAVGRVPVSPKEYACQKRTDVSTSEAMDVAHSSGEHHPFRPVSPGSPYSAHLTPTDPKRYTNEYFGKSGAVGGASLQPKEHYYENRVNFPTSETMDVSESSGRPRVFRPLSGHSTLPAPKRFSNEYRGKSDIVKLNEAAEQGRELNQHNQTCTSDRKSGVACPVNPGVKERTRWFEQKSGAYSRRSDRNSGNFQPRSSYERRWK